MSEQPIDRSRLGKRSKAKGRTGENEVVKILQNNGIQAERIPLSGSLKTQKYSCDVVMGNGKRIEVKRRKNELATIQKWLNEDENSNYVFFRADRGKWIVIMDIDEFIELASNTAPKGDREACR
jgi:Holliday junction resolvase